MAVNLGSAHGKIVISTSEAQKNVQSLSSSLKSAGTGMSAAITAPLVGIATVGLKATAAFSQNMNQVQAVTGATASAMEMLQGQALQLGRDTSFSSGEASKAMLELGKAGLDTTQIMGAMPGVLDLAAAGGISVARSAELAANAMNAFSIPAENMVEVADLLAAGANNSATSIDQLSLASQQSSSSFATNGQSLLDMTTALALMANAGIKGSDAGTSLKTAMQRLSAPTDKAQEVLDKLGISVFDASGKMLSFEEIIGDVARAAESLSDADRADAFNTIFGQDAIRAANVLATEGAAGFARMKAELSEVGAAGKVADARLKGLAGAIEFAKGSIESALITTFLPFEESIANMVRGAANMVTAFTQLPQPIQNAALAFTAVLAAAGPLLLAIPLIGAAISALLSPIGLVIAALAGLAAAYTTDFGGIQQQINALFENFEFSLDLDAKVATLNWGDFVSTLDWGTKVFTLNWGDFVARLDWDSGVLDFNWGDFITGRIDFSNLTFSLDWNDYITRVDLSNKVVFLKWGDFIVATDPNEKIITLKWGDYINSFNWDTKIQEVRWGDFLVRTDWANWIVMLQWGDYTSMLSWDTFVSSLTWDNFIRGVVDWGVYIAILPWNAFMTVLEWGAYASKLEWMLYVNPLAWGKYLADLDWGEHVSEFGEWASYINELIWESFIDQMKWPEFVDSLLWDQFIDALIWDNYADLLSWADFIKNLSWFRFIKNLFWDDFLDALSWDTFINALLWSNFITGISLSSKVFTLSWSDFVSGIDLASKVFRLYWGSFINGVSLAAYIPSFPGWGAFIGSVSIPGFATGTTFAPGGLALVGEKGPELVTLPRGSRVDTASTTRRILDGISDKSPVMNVTIPLQVYGNPEPETVRRSADRGVRDAAWALGINLTT